jgi:hypothetical protein
MITFWHFKRDELDGKPVEWERLFFFFFKKKGETQRIPHLCCTHDPLGPQLALHLQVNPFYG